MATGMYRFDIPPHPGYPGRIPKTIKMGMAGDGGGGKNLGYGDCAVSDCRWNVQPVFSALKFFFFISFFILSSFFPSIRSFRPS